MFSWNPIVNPFMVGKLVRLKNSNLNSFERGRDSVLVLNPSLTINLLYQCISPGSVYQLYFLLVLRGGHWPMEPVRTREKRLATFKEKKLGVKRRKESPFRKHKTGKGTKKIKPIKSVTWCILPCCDWPHTWINSNYSRHLP